MTAELKIIPYLHCDKKKWNDFVHRHSQGWWWQTTHWLDYVSCHPDHVNFSFSIEVCEEMIAISPNFLQGQELQMEGEPLPMGIYDDRFEVILTPILALHFEAMFGKLHWKRHRLRAPWPVRKPIPCPGFPWSDISWQTQVIELPAKWEDVRKSYRPLINKVMKERPIKIHGVDITIEAFERFHGLHRKARGRETRAVGTWAAMFEWLTMGHARLALVGDPPVAGAYFVVYKNKAYYASGASIEPDCQHAAIWAALLTLGQQDCKAVEMGWMPRPKDDDKKRNIAFFKAGFGGEAWSLPALESQK